MIYIEEQCGLIPILTASEFPNVFSSVVSSRSVRASLRVLAIVSMIETQWFDENFKATNKDRRTVRRS